MLLLYAWFIYLTIWYLNISLIPNLFYVYNNTVKIIFARSAINWSLKAAPCPISMKLSTIVQEEFLFVLGCRLAQSYIVTLVPKVSKSKKGKKKKSTKKFLLFFHWKLARSRMLLMETCESHNTMPDYVRVCYVRRAMPSH